MKKRIGIIGCGNMGSAIIKAVHGPRSTVHGYDVDEKKLNYVVKRYNAKAASSAADLVKECDVIILAVKPKDMNNALLQIKDHLNSSKVLISIAAGVNTKSIEKKIGKKVSVIRAMPNMPALIGAGVSAVCKGRFAAKEDLTVAKMVLKNIGEVVEVREGLMDAVTAISGSGPAYFFYLVEILIKAAVEMGVKKEIAVKLAVETALGSAKALKETKLSAEELRAKVTSKGGTTEAAFREFAKHNLKKILEKGFKRALMKAKEICSFYPIS